MLALGLAAARPLCWQANAQEVVGKGLTDLPGRFLEPWFLKPRLSLHLSKVPVNKGPSKNARYDRLGP